MSVQNFVVVDVEQTSRGVWIEQSYEERTYAIGWFPCIKCGNGYFDKGGLNNHIEREYVQQNVFCVEMGALIRVV